MAEINPLSLYDRLQNRYLECPLTHHDFLPLDAIEEEITEESVEAVLRPRKLSGLASKVVERTKKIFAVLEIIGERYAINNLLKEDITDSDLPLSRKDGKRQSGILVSVNNKTRIFPSFAKSMDPRRVGQFLAMQWLVLAPVLDSSGKEVKLSRPSALPFTLEDDEPASDDLGQEGNLDEECIGGQNLKPVGVNIHVEVYKNVVHPAHYKGLQEAAGVCHVATKKFTSYEVFVQEKVNLDKLKGAFHDHLIKPLAIWLKDPEYYIIFPWANGGNLVDFWKREDVKKRNESMALWSLQQLLGIASAVKALHRVNCRHGDLKPENILHFTHDNDGTLVVADFGVSRVHRLETHDRKVGTVTRATTPAYEAPEALLNEITPRARRYDVWSLGCVFLEFIIWFLEDFEAVDRFSKTREAPFREFYYLRRQNSPEIHPTVTGAIRSVRQDERCKGEMAFGELIDLIANHMLLVEVERRYSTDEVVEELERIVERAKVDESYLYKEVDPKPPRFHFLSKKESMALYQAATGTIYEEPSELDEDQG